MSINVGVVGATGMVGEVFLELLEERNFPVGQLRLFASDRSQGQALQFCGKSIELEVLQPGCFEGLHLVFFSSGDDISKEWAPQAVASGAFAVDNSAAFRLQTEVPLIVPEVNGHLLPPSNQPQLIANPNCSTIQLVVALQPLAKSFGLKSVHVATYQSVSGAGKAARDELLEQLKGFLNGDEQLPMQNFPHPIAFNCLPHIGSFNETGFCSEEVKIIKETKKILDQKDLRVSAFTVRIPAMNAHSEAAWVQLAKPCTRAEVLQSLGHSSGIQIMDNLAQPSHYPHALMASGTNPVYIGRIHQDLDNPDTWIMWIVSDNLRKGAALNGIQIAERIFDIQQNS